MTRAQTIVLTGLAILAGLVLLSGCTLTRGNTSLSLLTLPPTDVVTTRTMTMIGMGIKPSTGNLQLGYVRSVENNTPIVNPPGMVPNVGSYITVEPDGSITEHYVVQQPEEADGYGY